MTIIDRFAPYDLAVLIRNATRAESVRVVDGGNGAYRIYARGIACEQIGAALLYAESDLRICPHSVLRLTGTTPDGESYVGFEVYQEAG